MPHSVDGHRAGELHVGRGRLSRVDSSLIASSWLLPEGASFNRFKTEILLLNVANELVNASIYHLLEGDPSIRRDVTIPALSRLTVFADDTPGVRGKGFSTLVDSDGPIVVERSMYINTTRPSNIQWVSGTSSLGLVYSPPYRISSQAAGKAAKASLPRNQPAFPDALPTPTPTLTPTPTTP